MTTLQRRGVPFWHRRLVSLFVASLVLASLVALTLPQAALAAPAVTTTDLNLRDGPSLGAMVLLVMPEGAAVEITGTADGGFAPITYNGAAGWASVAFLSSSGSGPSDNVDGGSSGGTGSATTTTDLNLRAGPSTGDDVLTVMPPGAPVSLTGEAANGFSRVSYNGLLGWAFADYLSSGEPSAPGHGYPSGPSPDVGQPPVDGSGLTGTAVVTSSLNLRAGPSTADAVLLVMPTGATVTLSGETANGFAEVTYNGTAGWAFATYLGDGAAAPSDPAPSVPPTDGSASGDITQIIYAAADRYGQPRVDMLRVAMCESNLDPNAVNGPGGSYGLFQFLPGTWATTPYASYDIFDPWASANAAGWMWSVGRRGEWVCQ